MSRRLSALLQDALFADECLGEGIDPSGSLSSRGTHREALVLDINGAANQLHLGTASFSNDISRGPARALELTCHCSALP